MLILKKNKKLKNLVKSILTLQYETLNKKDKIKKRINVNLNKLM